MPPDSTGKLPVVPGLSRFLPFRRIALPSRRGRASGGNAGRHGRRGIDLDRRGRSVLDPDASREEAGAALLPQVRTQALEELIGRRLVLAYARRTGTPPGDAEIDAAQSQFDEGLKARHRTLADYLQRESFTEEDLRRQFEWNVVWDKFLARYLTAEAREAWFEAHHTDLDGTELLVSHILLRPGPGPTRPTDSSDRPRRFAWRSPRARRRSPRRRGGIRPGRVVCKAAGSAGSPAMCRWTRHSPALPSR